ncbi:MAG: glycosyltransferase [Polyangia bacterium]|jgi:glycosyltransferase involved in cell wall biosynthesis|nr:glycosyltransferase [Polyangia bacterium]
MGSASKSPLPIGMFVGSYLTFSETFIHDQLEHQRRLCALVCAYRRDEAAVRFPYEPVVILGPLERARYLLLGQAPSFSRALRRHGARLIHAHFGTNGALAAPFARALGVPLAVTFHGHDVGGLLPASRFEPRYLRYRATAGAMLRQAAVLLCASEELADRLVGEGLAPATKIQVHRLGVDTGRFGFVERPERPPTALMVGRFVEKKGFEYGLRALAQARREAPDLRAVLVGDGPLGPALRALSRDLGLEDAVAFRGALSADGVHGEMVCADLLLAPSVVAASGDRESGVIVIKEAAATGLPAVGTIHGGIPEIIDDGETGFLVPERDVDALAEKLGLLARDASIRASFGRAARARMERDYDTRRQNERLEELLLALL